MISPSAPVKIPAYYVFAMEGYTMLVYDGGRDDHQVYLHSYVRLFNPFPYDRPIGFTAYVHRIVQYQRNFVVPAVIPKHLPHHEVLLAVRYEKFGGVSRYLAATVAKILDITGRLSPQSPRTVPVPEALNPMDIALRAERLVRMPTSPASVRIGVFRQK